MRRRTFLRAGVGAVGLGTVGRGSASRSARADSRSDGGGRADGSPSGGTAETFAPLGYLELEGAKEAVVGADGRTAFVALGDGYATVDLSIPSEPTVLAERRALLSDRDGGPLREIHDVHVDGDRLLVVGPANPVEGAVAGALLVDVSNPESPRQIAFRETAYPIHNCVLEGGRAYLTANGLPGNPVEILDAENGLSAVGRWSLLDHDDAWSDVSRRLRPLHDLAVRDGIAYLAYWDAGVWLIDVTEPTAPTVVSHVGERSVDDLAGLEQRDADREFTVPPGNAHHVAVDDDATLMGVGRETWAVETGDGGTVGGPSGVDLYDISSLEDPTHLSTIDPPPTPTPTTSGIWTTAHNFDLADETLYTAWYQGGVKRHDVSDPADPVEESWWRRPREARFWGAQLAVAGGFFVAPDMGTDDSGAGLYTFPDSAGVQSSVPDPALTSEPSTLTETLTPAPPSTLTTTEAVTTAPATTVTTVPGFGTVPAIAALGIGAWRLLRGE